MIRAYVLIVTDPGATRPVALQLKSVPSVTDVHEVMGPYDIVAEIKVDDLSDVPPILGEHIRTIEGVESTTSLVTFPN